MIMIMIRSLVFVGIFYVWSVVVALAMLPLLVCPRRCMILAMAFWAKGVIGILRAVCQVRVEFRGLEHLPRGQALIAAKHQCMFDTMAPLAIFHDPCYVMKKELMKIPFYGWYSAKVGMMVVDRDGHTNAMRALLSVGKAVVMKGRQLVIFPEGSRTAPGTAGDYKPGIAGLYRTTGMPCTPLATNSGVHWPAHGFLRRPGTIVFEFLEPIPAGMTREVFMAELEQRIEAASERLLAE